MKIKSFKFSDPHSSKLELDYVEFNSRLNLFVGPSGSGKTRLFNMLFNIASMAIGKAKLSPGSWEIGFEHDGDEFLWMFEAAPRDDAKVIVKIEKLWRGFSQDNESLIFEREAVNVRLLGAISPKVSPESSCINIYSEEDAVKKAFQGFTQIMRRVFSGDELQNASRFQQYPRHLIMKFEANRHNKVDDLFGLNDSLHVTLYLLQKFFPKAYVTVLEQFKIVFPFVEDFVVTSLAKHSPSFGMDGPVVLLKEKGVRDGTSLYDISSGMVKVLLIITDVLCSPKNSLYMIDEYENSLGINAINFLPPFLAEFGGNRQFMLTTHHPVLINEIPIQDWFVFQRIGSSIKITKGSELVDKYGKSKQENFTQLLNDPRFSI